MHPTSDELREWRGMELTQRVYVLIKEALETWSNETCLGATADDSHRLAAQRDGARSALSFILGLGVEDDADAHANEARTNDTVRGGLRRQGT